MISGTSANTFITGMLPAPGITDADSAAYVANFPSTTAPIGIVVTSVDDTNGTWQYSLDGGTTWTDFRHRWGKRRQFPDLGVLTLEANSNGIVTGDEIRYLPNLDTTRHRRAHLPGLGRPAA